MRPTALRPRFAFRALPCGFFRVVPSMWSLGIVGAKVGGFFGAHLRDGLEADASLISVGSLNAVPKKLIPSGMPNTMFAGTCTMGYPAGAASPELPKMKWSP